MKNRFWVAFVCLVLSMGLLIGTASAEEPDYTFESGALVVNTAAGITAWEGTVAPGDITSVTIKSAVTEVPAETFQGLTNLTSLTFEGPVRVRIGSNVAFKDSANLSQISFGGAVALDTATFANHTALKSLTFPAGSTFGNSVFSGCTGLESITFQGDVELSGSAFFGLTNLTTLTFQGESTLTSGAFAGCANLENLTFGGKTSIGSGAMYPDSSPNTKLKSVTFPAGSTFSSGGFSNFYALESMTFEGDVNLSSGASVTSFPALKNLTFKGSATLGSGNFDNCGALESISFGGVTHIGSGVFSFSQSNPNTALKELTFPAGSTFGPNVFSNCTGLETITFQGDAAVTDYAFSGLSALNSLTFQGESSITGYAFTNCCNLENLTFGAKTNIASGGMFYNSSYNTKLKSVTFPEGSTFGGGGFSGFTALESMTFEGDVVAASGGLNNFPALKTLTFMGTCKLPSASFSNLPSVETITFGDAANIANGVFDYSYRLKNTTLKELTFPAGSVLGSGVFSGFTALESVTFQGDITVSNGAFKGATGLKTLTFQGKSTLNSGVFSDCSGLQTLTFGDATTLNTGALNCTSYTVEAMDPIVLPAGSVVGNSFFSGKPISSVEFLDAIPGIIGTAAFANCPADAVIYVPCGSVAAYTTALNEGTVPANPIPLAIDSKHNFSDWTGGESKHWKTCTNPGCTEIFEEGSHTGGSATCKDQAVCTVCEASYGAKADHDYTNSPWVSQGETGHAKLCIWCEVPGAEATHVFEDQYDPDCADCGYIRQVEERPADPTTAPTTAPTQPPKANTPATGDGSDLPMLLLVFFGSACLLAGILLSKKRDTI